MGLGGRGPGASAAKRGEVKRIQLREDANTRKEQDKKTFFTRQQSHKRSAGWDQVISTEGKAKKKKKGGLKN